MTPARRGGGNYITGGPPFREVGGCVIMPPGRGGSWAGAQHPRCLRRSNRVHVHLSYPKKENDKMGFGKDGKGVIIREFRSQALGALAGTSGIIIGTKLNILERFRMLKSEVVATIVAMTTAEGAGLGLYLVSGDLSLAEFEASVELTTGPLGPNDSVPAAIAERWSMVAGVMNQPVAGAGENQILNEHGGGLMSINPRWTFARTKSWNWIVYNHGTTLTTGATVKLFAKDFGVWVT